MTGLGYKQAQEDHNLFLKHSETTEVIDLLAYADDIIVMGDDEKKGDIDTQAMPD